MVSIKQGLVLFGGIFAIATYVYGIKPVNRRRKTDKAHREVQEALINTANFPPG